MCISICAVYIHVTTALKIVSCASKHVTTANMIKDNNLMMIDDVYVMIDKNIAIYMHTAVIT